MTLTKLVQISILAISIKRSSKDLNSLTISKKNLYLKELFAQLSKLRFTYNYQTYKKLRAASAIISLKDGFIQWPSKFLKSVMS